MRQRDSQLGARGQRCSYPGHHFVAHARCLERGDLLLCAAEEHRIAALKPDHDGVRPRGIDESLVDESLRSGMFPATLSDGDLLSAFGEGERVGMDERIVENDVGRGEKLGCPQREQVGGAGTSADKIHGVGHALDLSAPASRWPLTTRLRCALRAP